MVTITNHSEYPTSREYSSLVSIGLRNANFVRIKYYKLDVDVADSCLKMFYERVPELYGEVACTANMHSLCHIIQFVRQWGPLWIHSLFGFENMNCHIRRRFHGSRQVLDQLVFYVTAHVTGSIKGLEGWKKMVLA